ncbi:AAA family ATPase [Rhodoplanes sp. TEM]|uniref:AAA family ATPase n=1 Tax=Rhodoplanes tepidamans TaxID=200616 RepID=A0ABT5J6L5_RHOTP|nr:MULTISPECIES: AAA family ATPase [Rhodoplanes]MDC7784924.1 AAA family ATPase [Rhodoplanes tepidamans]MDC7983980.1 AAA family ATPase [Rhodoplanes sp. TEM]MDQ0353847.1 putative ATPase [Rhodoplanes tepidamans]
MRIREVGIVGYRSLRALRFPAGPLTVFVGANGVGKSNLYRSLQLLQGSAAGSLARELAAEGGMQSALWAGRRRGDQPVRIKLDVEIGDDAACFAYAVEAGLVPPTGAAFQFEQQVKEETLVLRTGRRPLPLLERRGPRASVTDEGGRRQALGGALLASETALGAIRDTAHHPEIDLVRRTMLDWRFYHDLRSDRASPLRQPCLAVTTPTLSSDGADLAAVFATLVHIRQDTADLDAVIDDAFPGARLIVPVPERTASFGLVFPDYPKRVFEAAELSDGTLRYLALAGALLGYRLPGFVALNEPEASLHPDLLEPLARMIVRAARRSQIWVVTHSQPLAQALAREGGVTPRTVIKRAGETWIEGLRLGGDFLDDEEEESEEA